VCILLVGIEKKIVKRESIFLARLDGNNEATKFGREKLVLGQKYSLNCIWLQLRNIALLKSFGVC
jgi:hypothetical protein